MVVIILMTRVSEIFLINFNLKFSKIFCSKCMDLYEPMKLLKA